MQNKVKKIVTKSEYFRHVNTMFPFENWMVGEGDGWYGLATAMMHAGVADDINIRVSAKDQKKLFGKVMFGKQCVRINSHTGAFETVTSQGYDGGDFDVQYHYPSHYYIQDGVWHQRTGYDLVW